MNLNDHVYVEVDKDCMSLSDFHDAFKVDEDDFNILDTLRAGEECCVIAVDAEGGTTELEVRKVPRVELPGWALQKLGEAGL